ncbi:CsgG/HfaB family protein [Marinifilum sp. D714]|uniref:CsgG/HfaB family protein n=1 Tax=Marinifilum sp. D714 TaxID=2937523 RepID=UPI0027BDED2F|nr:CsgG/HfaB family protein [Marinifilum sp. D714]MDQ2180196.1 CsgG/HfaB family protein [Marinifilum sp. D714]
MKKIGNLIRISALLILFSFMAFKISAQQPQIKKRIAVFVFEDKTDKSWRWWNNKGVGDGVSDMLTTALVKSGNYRVMERAEIDRILNEQDFGQSGRVTQQSAAKMGQVLGVEIAVIGSVSEFGYKRGETGGAVKGLGIGVSNQQAVVGVDVRMVNTNTGEIITAENVRKKKSAKGLKLRTKKLAFKDQKDFDESLVGKAAREAIEDVVAMIDNNANNIPWQAKVITEKEGVVFINSGEADGLQVGDVFAVYSKGEDLIDPDTGISLGSVDTKIGEIKITDASVGNGKASKCSIVQGSGFAKGNFVRMK